MVYIKKNMVKSLAAFLLVLCISGN
jgi:hypothetical protein